MKPNHGAQYEISIDGVPRTYRDRQDLVLETARFLKSQSRCPLVERISIDEAFADFRREHPSLRSAS
jgi:nucleotidyltransferase/DNA polymerase involved in DNA repair